MLTIAKERAKQVGLDNVAVFEASDAETYAYPSSSFNAVISGGLAFVMSYLKKLP